MNSQPQPTKRVINEPYYGDDLSEEIRRDSYNADHDLFEADTPYDYIVAGTGFHGYVDHPTMILAGEKGRERVNIHKHRKGEQHIKNKFGRVNVFDHKDRFVRSYKPEHDDMYDVSKYFEGRF